MNLDELAKQYGGTLVSSGASNLEALAQQYGGSLVGETDTTKQLPSTDRTTLEAVGDTAASLVSGVGKVIQLPGQLYGLATGDFSDTGALGLGKSMQDWAKSKQSAGLKAREEQLDAKIKEAELTGGQWEAFKTGFAGTVTDPALLISFITEQLPQLAPIFKVAKGAAIVAAGQASAKALAAGATKEAAAEAAKKAAIAGGTTGALQTGAVMQGADVGASSYDDIFQELRKTMSDEEAAQETINKARLAGLTGYGLSLLANRFLPGGKAIEEIIAGKKIAGSRLATGAATAAKEIIPENIEEVGGRITQNVAAQQAGLDRDTFAGAGETAAMATIGAAGIGGGLGALSKRTDAEDAKKPEAVKDFEKEKEEFRKGFKPTEEEQKAVQPVVETKVDLPGGYTATQREVSREEVPEKFGIFSEGSEAPLTTVINQEDADQKLETLASIRAEEGNRIAAEIENIQKKINEEQRQIDVLEATGKSGTDEYVKATTLFEQNKIQATEKIDQLSQQIFEYEKPLSVEPIGTKQKIQSVYDITKDNNVLGTFNTLEEAQTEAQRLDPEAFKQVEVEQQTQRQERIKQLEEQLLPAFKKFQLQDVGFKVVENLKNNAGGAYFDKLVQVAMNDKNPIQTMRHEALHAVKDLGLFTNQQWNALVEQANKTWIKQYLENQSAEIEIDGKKQSMSRLDAYRQLGLSQEAIIEEAIADAFGAYDKGAAPPPGMIAALFKKLKNFFMNFNQAMRGAGFESAEDIFQVIERGEFKPSKAKAPAKVKAAEEKTSLIRPAVEGEIEISTQNPSGVRKKYDPITQMLSIDEKAVMEVMKVNPQFKTATINAIKSYGFIPNGVPNKDVISVFKQNIVNNLLYLYNQVPAKIRNRSKLWYDGANIIAKQMADKYDLTHTQVAAIMAAMSPQKDWFQNVSMGERAIDILINQGDKSWSPQMLAYAQSYVKEAEKREDREKREDQFQKILKVASTGTPLKEMDNKSAAAFIRAYDEAFNSRQYRIVTPEGGFGDFVTNNDGTPSIMMWSTYVPIEKAVSIFRDGSRKNISEQLGFEHKIRSFYNNIAAPNSDIEHVTIDTHAVAAALFEALSGTDAEVVENFGKTGKSSIVGVGGTYGIIADAYREAAKQVGIQAREMQSITWEAVRGLFSENIKKAIKQPVKNEWDKYKSGEQSFEQTRENIIEIARDKRSGEKNVNIPVPDWVNSGKGTFVEDGGESYDKSYIPEGGVRLRQENEIREKLVFNLSAVTKSIPGLQELYARAMARDKKAFKVLQDVADSSLTHLLSGTKAKISVERSRGVYLSDREPSLMATVSFNESESVSVLAALEKFARNFNQQQIHVRSGTNKPFGFDYGDGSYATTVFTIPLKKELTNNDISSIIDKTGLQGFTVTENKLVTYWVRPNQESGETNAEYTAKARKDFIEFKEKIKAAHVLVGTGSGNITKRVERLYVYGDEGDGAAISYESIYGNVYPKQSKDTVTPRIIAEYLTGETVEVFKPKTLTKQQVKEQKELAEIFNDITANDLKNPLVKKAYKALIKVLKEQFEILPIKVELQTDKFEEGDKIPDNFKVGDLKPPYNNNSADMRKDIVDNNHLIIYPTLPETFGPEGQDFSSHPLLEDANLTDVNGKPLLFNDVLRAVHDYFAHGLSEAEFGPKGEFTAWKNHMAATPSPMARWALTAETRFQNAWQNFRAGVEDAKLSDRPFATQKAALPPAKYLFTGNEKVDEPVAQMLNDLSEQQLKGSVDSKYGAKYSLAAPDTEAFKRWFGESKIVDKNEQPKVMYHGTARDITEFKPKQAGAIFLTDDPEFASGFSKMSAKWMSKHAEQFLEPDQLAEGKKAAIAQVKKDYKADPELKQNILYAIEGKNKDFDIAFREEAAEYLGKAYVEMLPTGPNVMPVFVRAENPFDYANKEHRDFVFAQLPNVRSEEAANLERLLRQGDWETIETKTIQDAIKNAGFDSFYVLEMGRKNIAVYTSNQIKSATGNVGTYDIENPDVRYSIPTVPSQIEARINETTFKREQKGFATRIVEAIFPKSAAHFRAQYLNRYNQMSVYDKKLVQQMGGAQLLASQSAEAAALFSDLGMGVSASAMGFGDRAGGIPILRNGITTIDRGTKGLIASLQPLAKYNDPVIYQRYQYWAMVKRGVRLNAQGKQTGIDVTDVAYAKQLEQMHPEFIGVQKDLNAFNNGLVQYMVDTGVLSKERGAEYTKYADYVPFYRQMDGENTVGPNLFSSMSGVKPPKKLKGKDVAEAPIADFLETMVRNTQAAINSGVKNYAAQRAMDVVTQVKAPGMGAVRLNTVETGPNIINVLEKGTLVSYETPDVLIVNAMMSLNQGELPFMGILSTPANVLRNLVTKDPGFMMANLLRDSLSAFVTSGQNMVPVVGTVINYGKALTKNSPGFEAMIDAGLIGGYEFSDNVEKSGEKLEKDLAKKSGKKEPLALRPFKSLWDALEKGTTASDAATRALIYEQTLKDTGSEAEALYRALEVMNFHRKGSSPLIRVLTAAVPFFNARLQGLDLFYRAASGNMNTNDAAAIQRKFYARGATMAALSVYYYWLVSDDDEYKSQEQETRDNNWIIPKLGIKIPIPFEVGVLFKVIPERIAAYTFGDDTGKDLTDSFKRAAMSTFAFNPIPQTVKPVVEALFDFNTFTWRSVVSPALKDAAPRYQVSSTTSNVAKGIGEALDLSPIKVDHVIKGYTGTMGMYTIDLIDMILDQFSDSPKATKRFEQMPVIKRFAVDPEARGAVTQYYQLKDAVDTTVRTLNLLEKTNQFEEYQEYLKENIGTYAFRDYVRSIEKTMKELREAKVAVQSSKMSADDKQKALIDIGRAEKAITANIQEVKKAISKYQ